MPKDQDEERELTAAELLEMDDASAPRPPADLAAALDAAEADDEERLHPILTNKEFREAQAKARKQLSAEERKKAFDEVVKAEIEKQRGPAGLLTGKPELDEMVDYTIDLPEFAASVVINGQAYWHGQTYKIPRHVANTLSEQVHRARNHQLEIDGKGLGERLKVEKKPIVSAKTLAVTA